jgi:hypothetical protein
MTGAGRVGARRRGRVAAAALAAAIGLAGGAVPAAAQGSAPGGPQAVRATVTPSQARLGERLTYRGSAVVPRGTTGLKWLPPEEDPEVAWSPLRARVGRGADADTLAVESEIQIFRTGAVSIPGLRLQAQDPAQPTTWRLPAVRVVIAPVLTAADSNADLRNVRGPLAAPWWERVPWLLVVAGGLLAGLAVALWMWLRRRGRVEVAAAAAPADPATLALQRLADLRAKGLAARGRYGEHAFELTRILRRFLEATLATPRPGDTTASLQSRLEGAGVAGAELVAVMELLRYWDRVKFAQVPTTAAEATAAEAAVEEFVRRRAAPVERQAA